MNENIYKTNENIYKLIPKEWLDKIDYSILTETIDNLENAFVSSKKEIYPSINDIFRIFNECSFENIKVVIIGQDPYHNKGQANGIAFSVNNDFKIPPSLKNIYKELLRSYKKENNTILSGDLSLWVKQGVFLLNTSLTVLENKPGSHIFIWKKFTDHIIDIIQNKGNVIFCLWGKFAEEKQNLIKNNTNIILKSSHPSPLSAYKTNNSFMGSNMFLEINNNLLSLDKTKINWLN